MLNSLGLLRRILQQILNFHCNEETFVLLLHSLHQSIWRNDDDDAGGGASVRDETAADKVTTAALTWISKKPFYYRFLPFHQESFIDCVVRSLDNQQRNQVLIYELIAILFSHLRDVC